MKRVRSFNGGQNVMSFRGLQLIKSHNSPYISVGSIRNLAKVSGEELKDALSTVRVRTHRIFVKWNSREFQTTCIHLKDLETLDRQLGGGLNHLVQEIGLEYRNIL